MRFHERYPRTVNLAVMVDRKIGISRTAEKSGPPEFPHTIKNPIESFPKSGNLDGNVRASRCQRFCLFRGNKEYDSS